MIMHPICIDVHPSSWMRTSPSKSVCLCFHPTHSCHVQHHPVVYMCQPSFLMTSFLPRSLLSCAPWLMHTRYHIANQMSGHRQIDRGRGERDKERKREK